MGAIFISYRREDAEGQAGRLFEDLTRHFGVDSVFMDVAGIKPGRDFRRAIDEHVASCSVLLALMGKRWLDATNQSGQRRLDDPGDFVRLETASALKRDIPVIPVLVQGAQMPRVDQLPPELAELVYRNGVEVTHARWESDVRLLIQALGPLLDVSRKDATGAGNASDRRHVGSAGVPEMPATGRAPSAPAGKRTWGLAMVGLTALIVVSVAGFVWYQRRSQDEERRDPVELATAARAEAAPQSDVPKPEAQEAAEKLAAPKETDANDAADKLAAQRQADAKDAADRLAAQREADAKDAAARLAAQREADAKEAEARLAAQREADAKEAEAKLAAQAAAAAKEAAVKLAAQKAADAQKAAEAQKAGEPQTLDIKPGRDPVRSPFPSRATRRPPRRFSLVGSWSGAPSCALEFQKDDGIVIEGSCDTPGVLHRVMGSYDDPNTVTITISRTDRATGCRTRVAGSIAIISSESIEMSQSGWAGCGVKTGPVTTRLSR